MDKQEQEQPSDDFLAVKKKSYLESLNILGLYIQETLDYYKDVEDQGLMDDEVMIEMEKHLEVLDVMYNGFESSMVNFSIDDNKNKLPN